MEGRRCKWSLVKLKVEVGLEVEVCVGSMAT